MKDTDCPTVADDELNALSKSLNHRAFFVDIAQGAPRSTHQYPPKLTRSASLHNSPGPQVLSIHRVRRPSKFTRSAGLTNAPVPQALSIHEARPPERDVLGAHIQHTHYYQPVPTSTRRTPQGMQASPIHHVLGPYI